jgi:hypothetical protein
MKNYNLPNYEVMLDMISAFQWNLDQSCIRLAVDHSLEHPVLKAVNKLAGEIFRATTGRHVGNAQVIQEVLSRRPDLLYTGNSDEVCLMADQIVELVGVGCELIGVGNLCVAAFALTMRPRVPRRWNDFCHHVDKPLWQVDIQRNSDGVSSSLGTPPAAPSPAGTGYTMEGDAEELSEEDFRPNTTGECVATKDGVERVYEPIPIRRGGLAGAFDDAAFNKKADRLLNRHQEEDIAAHHSVISEPESVPTKCSTFHNVIQEKFSAVRSCLKGGKR